MPVSYTHLDVYKRQVFGVWVAMTLDWAVRAVLFLIRYIKGKWQYRTI